MSSLEIELRRLIAEAVAEGFEKAARKHVERGALTAPELAQRWNLSAATIHRRIEAGLIVTLPVAISGPGKRLIPIPWIEDMETRHRSSGVD